MLKIPRSTDFLFDPLRLVTFHLKLLMTVIPKVENGVLSLPRLSFWHCPQDLAAILRGQELIYTVDCLQLVRCQNLELIVTWPIF